MQAKTVYRALLYCYPAAFRQEYGSQMQLMFAEQLGDARRTGGLRAAGLWLHAAVDAITIAPKEHCHVIHQDLRYALRTMASSPGFTAVAVLSLALGIGANTAIFGLWNGMLNSWLPGVHEPEKLLMLTDPGSEGMWSGNQEGDRDWLTYAEFEKLRDRAVGFSGMMASQSSLERWNVRYEAGGWEEARGRLVSGGYFDVLGVNAALGRVFTRAEEGAEAPDAVISYGYWQRRFGGRPDVLGKTFSVRNVALTIIGVAPRGFIGETAGQQPDVWLPLRLQPMLLPGNDWLHDTPPSKVMWLQVFGRLKPGVSEAQAGAEANAIFKADLAPFYGSIASEERRRRFLDQGIRIRQGGRGASETRDDFSRSLTALLAAVGVLLLIACANLANLLLARGAARKAEIALRVSLGASRGRLMRQLITESMTLAIIGGLAGLAVAYVLHGVLVRMIGRADSTFHMSFTLDPAVAFFAVAATVGAALLFGVLPAWQVTKTDAGSALKQQGRNSTGRMRSGRLLVSLQLALSLPLLVGAGLLVRTLYQLQHVDLGYPGDHLLLVQIDSRSAGYNSTRSMVLFHDLLEQIKLIPGVRAASFSHNGLFTGSTSSDDVEVEGFTSKQEKDRNADWEMVGPGYFATLGVPILLGRGILESDTANSPKVCVINEAFAKRFFEGRNPIGMHVTTVDGNLRTTHQVVGVAKNWRTQGLRHEVDVKYMVPVTQPTGDNVKRATFLIRTATGSASVMGEVRKGFARVDPTLPINSSRTLEQQMAPNTAQDRSIALLAVVFGGVALTLAAIGLYGVLSYGVARRRSEIAVRIALGAQPGRVVGMILGETSGVVLGGLAFGAGLAYAATRLMTSQLYGVAPQDPVTVAAAIGMLVLVALSAAYLPARRASRLDPMAALRQE